ncbi:7961_t:CDS:2 [Entrophospora sp. SA101]|nr:7961_t:CDS:2 [Entrophospora sp. SA101]
MSSNKSDEKKKGKLPETEEPIKVNNNNNQLQNQQKSVNETPSSNNDNIDNKLVSSTTSVVNNNYDSSTLDKSKSILLNNNKNYVIKIQENEQVADENSIFDEKLNNLNINRKLSNAEEDVCYPIRPPHKKEGIDFEALEEYIREENALMAKKKNNSTTTVDNNDDEARTISSTRRFSQYTENIKPPDLTEELRFTFYSTETGTIRANCFSEIPPKGQTMTELLRQGCFWIDVLSPTDSEMRILSSIFQIHPLTMEDIETEESREKCELFKNYYFINFQSYDQNNCIPPDIEPTSMFNVVMREGILSFHFQPTPHAHNVRRRIRQLKDYIRVTPVEFQSDAIDQLVMVLKNSEQQDMLMRIGICRKMVMTLLKLLGTKADVIKALIKRCEEIIAVGGEKLGEKHGPGDVVLYLGDIQDHILTMLQNLNHYELILSRAHSNYLAQISIEITQLSNKTNNIINKLTAFATILLPMNVVTGLFGMNVKVPGQDEDNLIWFLSIVGAISLFGLIGYFIVMRIQIH